MNTVTQGSLLIAILISFSAGIISFLSPCVLPLVPGYLSFITGFGLESSKVIRKSKAIVATLLFIAGFTFVFVCIGMFFGGIGSWFIKYGLLIERIMGVFVIALGLSYLGVWKIFNREYRFHAPVKQGLIGAPLLGALFAIGWTPCIGPALGAVQTLAFQESSAMRGAILSLGYCIGLGAPFIASGLFFDRSENLRKFLVRRGDLITKVGGVFLILIGLAQVFGLWGSFNNEMRSWISDSIPVI